MDTHFYPRLQILLFLVLVYFQLSSFREIRNLRNLAIEKFTLLLGDDLIVLQQGNETFYIFLIIRVNFQDYE